MYDIHGLEADYLAQVSSGGEVADGDGESEQVMWCGLPDGGIGKQAWWRGWEEEVGSEEEVRVPSRCCGGGDSWTRTRRNGNG